MTCRILRSIALIALLAALPFGGNHRLAGQTSAPRFILCAPATAVAGIAQRHGLTVVRPLDQHAHDIFLVTGPSGVATADLVSLVRSDAAVTNFEPDATRSLTESGPGLNQSTVAILDQSTVAILDQSTVAILDALADRSLVPFGDLDVWSGYINQPAATTIRLPEAHAQFGTGTALVALIDEGVDPNHPLLAPALVPGYDFIRNLPGIASEWVDLDQKLIAQLNQSTVAILDQSTVAILDGSTPAILNQSTVAILDQSTVAILDATQVPTAFGHGTMMAGAIRLAAPGAQIMPLKAFQAAGTANLFDVIRAIYHAVENGADVIVMGFSMPEASVELAHAINFATSNGAVAVAAAGNNAREALVFPAALRTVVGVGSTSPTGQRSVFSNFGNALVRVAAPGESIITSYPGARFAAAAGTSFSAALVGGAVALMRSANPALTPDAIGAGIGKGAVGTDALKLGAGRVDVFEALKSLTGSSSAPPPPPPTPNESPVAANDMVTVAEDSSITIDVRVNDSDADGDPLSVLAVTTPTNGTAVLAATGAEANQVTYQPGANFTGVDSFTYTISDGRATATAAVTVTVTGQNEIPVATADSAATQEDAAVVIDVLANDTDGDGEPLSVLTVSGASHGTATIETAGPDAGRIRYVPGPNAVGTDTFSYSVADTRSGTASGTVTVVVSGINDAPVAANDAASGPEDTAVAIDLVANDSDVDGDVLTVTSVTQPSHGSVAIITDGAAAGRVNYTPAANFSGSDSFAYTLDDGNGGTATGLATVTVTSVNDTPVAAADTATGAEDGALAIDVVGNDTDIDGDQLTITAVTQPANGAVTIAAGAQAGKVTYTPAANFAGAETFTYTIVDGNGGTATATVGVTITSINDAPIAGDDTTTTAEDTAVVIAVTTNDTDVDSDLLVVTGVTQAASGAAAVIAEGADAGSIGYRPAANFAGTDTFTYTVADGNGGTATASVTVTVSSVNDAPIASDDAATGPEDAVLVFDVVANDSDADRERLTVTTVTQPAHGSAAVLAEGADAGSIAYTPAADFAGADRFTYTVSDGSGETATATVTLTITALNDQPVAVDDSGTTAEDTPLAVEVAANDTDADGDVLTVTALTAPAHGTAAVDAGQVTYTPTADFAGTDSFSYTVSDGNGGTATGTVNIAVTAVDDAPVAGDDAATGAEDAALVIDVVANDRDPDGGAVQVQGITQPAHGSATVIDGGKSISYSPAADFAGTDRFTYTLGDGNGESAPATVTVTVTPVNDQPSAMDDSGATAEDTPVAIQLVANDVDPDGDSLAVTAVGTPAHGTATVDAAGLTYTPAANYAGIDSFTYTVSDGHGGSATATVTVTVSAVDDEPVAGDDAATGPEDAALVIDVVANDRDPDGGSLQVQSMTQPGHGSVTAGAGGRSISYSPAANFAGTDQFTYTVSDGTGESAPATVTVTITGLNDQPTAGDDVATTGEDAPVVIQATANDSDPDGDTLAVTAVTAAAHGTAAVDAGTVTYTPAANFAGTDTFTYTVSDGNGSSATATITVTVSAADDAPIAADDVATGPEDAALVIDVTANDRDPDGGTVTVQATTQPAHGTVTLGPGGSIGYTPAANFAGTDRFTYTVSDGTSASAPATVTLTITALNDPPAATDDAATTGEDVPLVIQAVANDTDPDGDALTVTGAGAAAHGTVTVDAGQVTYAPAPNFAGTDSFTYTIADGNGATATGTIQVTVVSANDPPSAGDDAALAAGDGGPIAIDVLGNDSIAPDTDEALIILAAGTGATGTVAIDGSTLVYTPAAGFTGSDVFNYTIGDGHGGTATATVLVTVAVP